MTKDEYKKTLQYVLDKRNVCFQALIMVVFLLLVLSIYFSQNLEFFLMKVLFFLCLIINIFNLILLIYFLIKLIINFKYHKEYKVYKAIFSNSQSELKLSFLDDDNNEINVDDRKIKKYLSQMIRYASSRLEITVGYDKKSKKIILVSCDQIYGSVAEA